MKPGEGLKITPFCQPTLTLGIILKNSRGLKQSFWLYSKVKALLNTLLKFQEKIPTITDFTAVESWKLYFSHFRLRTL